jgi:hypothetical protein
MKPLAALLALLALLVATPAAAAEQRLASEARPFVADAYGDVIAWSGYDPAARVYRLRVSRAGVVTTPAVDASPTVLDLDVGPGPDGAPLVVYSRRGDIFQYDPASGLEQPLAEVNTPGTELHPSIHRSALGFVRRVSGKPVLYRRAGGDTKRQPRPRFKRTLAIEDVELSGRGLFVVYRTDIPQGSCCTSATLYRVRGKKLRHVFVVGSGGANFGQLLTPAISGRSVYFARTNEGSGTGNRFFRFDLGTRRLFAARGTSRAVSVTPLPGNRLLLSRETFPGGGAPEGGELLVTDPIAYTRAPRTDARRTRP